MFRLHVFFTEIMVIEVMDSGTNPGCGFFFPFFLVRCTSVTHRCMCPLSAESNVFLELDLTGLFHWGSVGGPIKRERDEINRGDSLYQIRPREFSLAEDRVREKKGVFSP